MIENAWKNSGFLKSNKGLLCTPDLMGEVSLNSLVTIFKGKVTNIFNKQEIKDFVLSHTNVSFFHHLFLITQHALATINGSIAVRP